MADLIQKKEFLLWLMQLDNIGPVTINRLRGKLKNQEKTWEDVIFLSPLEISEQFEVPLSKAETLSRYSEDWASQVESLLDNLDNKNIQISWIEDPEYPQFLENSLKEEAPPVLIWKGNSELFNGPSGVAMVGRREASPQGLKVSQKVATQLGLPGIAVVSGFAEGIDSASHFGALESGGDTVVVLPHGILKFKYKEPFVSLMDSENTLLVSQFFPTKGWFTQGAILRNKVISGLSAGTIVVEADLSGGTHHTAKNTLDQQKPLWVLTDLPKVGTLPGNQLLIDRGGTPLQVCADGEVNDIDRVFKAYSDYQWAEFA